MKIKSLLITLLIVAAGYAQADQTAKITIANLLTAEQAQAEDITKVWLYWTDNADEHGGGAFPFDPNQSVYEFNITTQSDSVEFWAAYANSKNLLGPITKTTTDLKGPGPTIEINIEFKTTVIVNGKPVGIN